MSLSQSAYTPFTESESYVPPQVLEPEFEEPLVIESMTKNYDSASRVISNNISHSMCIRDAADSRISGTSANSMTPNSSTALKLINNQTATSNYHQVNAGHYGNTRKPENDKPYPLASSLHRLEGETSEISQHAYSVLGNSGNSCGSSGAISAPNEVQKSLMEGVSMTRTVKKTFSNNNGNTVNNSSINALTTLTTTNNNYNNNNNNNNINGNVHSNSLSEHPSISGNQIKSRFNLAPSSISTSTPSYKPVTKTDDKKKTRSKQVMKENRLLSESSDEMEADYSYHQTDERICNDNNNYGEKESYGEDYDDCGYGDGEGGAKRKMNQIKNATNDNNNNNNNNNFVGSKGGRETKDEMPLIAL
uniref:Uncharacterized protein n=1 Tax=Polytomella parva TaxID=51329 RepID=A0A7S0V1U7_9CHLO|mmetsp:Transcript_25735/g.46950  ORF Transcript_25735/g.46950 Transcript_25735/m.46950 type:complete len:362 (+) Transcript_25735:461-1546(+)